jgi:hypothetical protein
MFVLIFSTFFLAAIVALAVIALRAWMTINDTMKNGPAVGAGPSVSTSGTVQMHAGRR